MKLLVLNWKDIRNPSAGGAEVFLQEVSKRWVEWGHEVTLFCRQFPGSPADDHIDGVRIVRRGNTLSVYHKARNWLTRLGDRFDVVLDTVNTRPFMSHNFTRLPVVAVIFQVAADVWYEETPFPINVLGNRILEPRWLRSYRDVPTVTISNSTLRDLQQRGFRRVEIVPVGLDRATLPALEGTAKEDAPTLLFVGRFVKTKRPQDALAAHAMVRRELPDTRLWMVGDGYMKERLARTAPADAITFMGRIPESEKYSLMKRAHVLLVPGVREGWGLVVIEAAAVGTPSVGYRIPGLMDAIREGETGLLVDPEPEALAAGALRLLGDASLRQRLGDRARSWSQTFQWDDTARLLLSVLDQARPHAQS